MVTVKTYLFDLTKGGWIDTPDKELDSSKTLLFCFGNLHKNSKLKEAYLDLSKKFPNSKIVGCSTAGEIKDKEYFENSLTVGAIKFNESSIYTLLREFKRDDDYKKVGKEVIEEIAKKNRDLKSVIFFCDGININGTKLVEGMNEALPKGVVLSGGLAGDGVDFKKTVVFCRDKIFNSAIVVVGLYGKSLFVKSNYKGGWDKFGIERKITSAKDNILYSLNGEPALKVYKRYLGDYSKKLPASALLFPLLIKRDKKDEPKVRTILGIDEKHQAMIFAGDIPEGGYATFMKANLERLLDAASLASFEINQDLPQNTLCISISCVGRHLVLKQRTEEELEAVMESLPKDVKQIGFYSYGEISGLQNRKCDLHNQTMTITLVGEI